MMLENAEVKFQNWRAVADLGKTDPALIILGRSSKQVRQTYEEAFRTLLDDEDQARVHSILLQQWQGAADAGKWKTIAELRHPNQLKGSRLPEYEATGALA